MSFPTFNVNQMSNCETSNEFLVYSVSPPTQIFQEHPLDEPYCSWMEEFENSTSVVYEHTSGDPTSATVWNNGNGVCSSDKEDITNQPNTALLSTILTIGTFLLAYFLRMFRNSRFLGRGVRMRHLSFLLAKSTSSFPISIFADKVVQLLFPISLLLLWLLRISRCTDLLLSCLDEKVNL